MYEEISILIVCMMCVSIQSFFLHTYIHSYIQTYIHTYIHTYIQCTYIHTYQQSWLTTIALDLVYSLTNPFISYKTNLRRYQIMVRIFTYLHTYIHTYIHTLHTYIIYIHTYIMNTVGVDLFVFCVFRFLLRHRMPRPVPGYPPYIHCILTYCTYIHILFIYIHTYIHTHYSHTYIDI